MSVVACRMLKNGYEMAADSIRVSGWRQRKGTEGGATKLSFINDVHIGAVGLCSTYGLLAVFLKTRRPASSEMGIIEFMSDFADWKQKKVNSANISECDFLIGLHDAVWEFKDWFVQRVTNFTAVGAGEEFALASLHLGHTAKEAVETACELSVYCERPVKTFTRRFKKAPAVK